MHDIVFMAIHDAGCDCESARVWVACLADLSDSVSEVACDVMIAVRRHGIVRRW